jgi:hypothetical protein
VKTKKLSRTHFWLSVIGIAFCLWLIWLQKAMSGTVYWPQSFVSPDYDSVRVIPLFDSSGTFVPTGDTEIVVIPKDTTVTVYDTTNWKIKTIWFSGADSSVGMEPIIFSSASVTLSTADLDSLEERVLSGSGPYGVSVTVRDTTGGGSTVIPSALVTFRDPSITTNIRQERTDVSGRIAFYTSHDTLTYIASYLPYYGFPTWDTVVPSVSGTVTISGYSWPDTAGSSVDRTCAVKVYVIKTNGSPANNVPVSMSLNARSNVIDSAGHAILKTVQTERTDSTGSATFVCLWSSYMIPETKWNVNVILPGRALSRSITVPRDTVYTVDFTTD